MEKVTFTKAYYELEKEMKNQNELRYLREWLEVAKANDDSFTVGDLTKQIEELENQIKMANQKQLKESLIIKEMYKYTNAIDTNGARYLDCDSITDVESLQDFIEILEYHKEQLDNAIQSIQERIEEIEQ